MPINYIQTLQSGGNLPSILKSLSGQQPWHTSGLLTAPPPPPPKSDDSSSGNSNLSKNFNNQSTPGSGAPDTTPSGFAPTDAELSGGITGTGLDAGAGAGLDAGAGAGLGAGADAGIGGMGAGIGEAGAGAGMGIGEGFPLLAALFA